jgi:hypothetical protein
MDTATKRGSVLGTLRRYVPVLPFPDGTIAQADRQFVAGTYAGILAGEAIPLVPIRGMTFAWATRRMAIAWAARRVESVAPVVVTGICQADAVQENAVQGESQIVTGWRKRRIAMEFRA